MASHGTSREGRKGESHRPFQFLRRPLCGLGTLCQYQARHQSADDQRVHAAMGRRAGNEVLRHTAHGLGTLGARQGEPGGQPPVSQPGGEIWQDPPASGLALPAGAGHHRHPQEHAR